MKKNKIKFKFLGTKSQNIRSIICGLISMELTLLILTYTKLLYTNFAIWFYLPVAFILYIILYNKSFEVVKEKIEKVNKKGKI